MRVLITTAHATDNLSRHEEIEFALRCNVSAFDSIVVLADGLDAPTWFPSQGWKDCQQRPTYEDALARASEAGRDDLVVIANCDIVIAKPELVLIDFELQRGEAYALTRWEMQEPYPMKLWPVAYSQDAWCFRGPPRGAFKDVNFWFGVPGCDNRFNWELRNAGYEMKNPSRDVRTYHVHATEHREKTNVGQYRVPPPYLYLEPTHLGLPQEMEEAHTMKHRQAIFASRPKRHRRKFS